MLTSRNPSELTWFPHFFLAWLGLKGNVPYPRKLDASDSVIDKSDRITSLRDIRVQNSGGPVFVRLNPYAKSPRVWEEQDPVRPNGVAAHPPQPRPDRRVKSGSGSGLTSEQTRDPGLSPGTLFVLLKFLNGITTILA
ncbi:hypothetical protein DFH09DRAFT_1290784 [Mycena vulgaris]|nr:hypothetical protein DFH09DRAFT_1290784 [Mycena vulgaris]